MSLLRQDDDTQRLYDNILNEIANIKAKLRYEEKSKEMFEDFFNVISTEIDLLKLKQKHYQEFDIKNEFIIFVDEIDLRIKQLKENLKNEH